MTPGLDVPLDPRRMEANRNFANKLWNSARFILGNLDGLAPADRQARPDPARPGPARRADYGGNWQFFFLQKSREKAGGARRQKKTGGARRRRWRCRRR